MNYRPEIDGLRAFAVISVIFYHAGYEVFAGGFVGVDIFFVISGYLITNLIFRELMKNNFNLINFYERRMRRIFPALFFMLFVTSIFSFFLMNPWQLKDYGQSLFASIIFASNIFFWLENDYWGQSSEFLPLLHTWSLSVEEQFYLLFPLMLMSVWRYGFMIIIYVIFSLILISMISSFIIARSDTVGNFYFIHTRAWELLIGALVAALGIKKEIKNNNFLTAMGILLVVFSVFTFDETIIFPGLYTLVPVIGTSLFIGFSGENNFASRLFKYKIFVYVGLISYPLYLWHQAIFALMRVDASFSELTNLKVSIGMIVATLLAIFTYHCIEKPIRHKSLITRKSFFSIVVLISILLTIFGLILHFTDGLKKTTLAALPSSAQHYFTKLELQNLEREILKDEALKTANYPFITNENRKILIIGDSIAQDLFISLSRHSSTDELQYRMLEFDDSCARFIDTNFSFNSSLKNDCQKAISNFFGSELYNDADAYILAAGWFLRNIEDLNKIVEKLVETRKPIHVFKSAAFTPIGSLILSFNKDQLKSDHLREEFIYAMRHPKAVRVNKAIDKIVGSKFIKSINGYDAFCNESKKRCDIFSEDDVPLIIDHVHLSREGFKHMSKWVEDKLLMDLEKYHSVIKKQ